MKTEYQNSGFKTFIVEGGSKDSVLLQKLEFELICRGLTPAFSTGLSKEEAFKILLNSYDSFVYVLSQDTTMEELREYREDIRRIELFSQKEGFAKLILLVDFHMKKNSVDKKYPILDLKNSSDSSLYKLSKEISRLININYKKVEKANLNGLSNIEYLLYNDSDSNPIKSVIVTDLFNELKQYLAKHPEKIYDLSPRNFEELVADILHDFGFDCELTPATRDGGFDIYAQIKNSITSFLMYVECKKYSQFKNVGAEVIRSLYGTSKMKGAHKSMIVTTSFFSEPAKKEHNLIRSEMELNNFDNLKQWLQKYS